MKKERRRRRGLSRDYVAGTTMWRKREGEEVCEWMVLQVTTMWRKRQGGEVYQGIVLQVTTVFRKR